MSSWHSYPKVYAIGHGAVAELFLDDIIVEEKVDGSQFSFGIFNGELKLKSKNNDLIETAPEKMFDLAVETVLSIKDKLVDGWTYRAEYLQKPKHNVLAYDRTPYKNIILFDINTGEETYLSRREKESEAIRLGLEIVPLLFEGKVSSEVDLEKLLTTTSVLGGQKVEGFVCKNYSRFDKQKKALMGKFVSENFKEKHKKDWKEENPGQNDIIELLIAMYRTTARWDKAIIHLKEAGQLEGNPTDIGKVVKEVPKDLLSECEDEIKKYLMDWALPKLMRGVNRGLAQYYKERLMKSQFENKE